MKSITTFFNEITLGKSTILMLSPLLSTITSMKTLLLGLSLLIVIDLFTGIRKNLFLKSIKFNVLKADFWSSIKSYMLRKTWVKFYEYIIGILSVLILESLILGQTTIEIMDKSFTITELAIMVPACVEVWSIYENFEAISGNNLLKKFKGYILDKILKKDETNSTEY